MHCLARDTGVPQTTGSRYLHQGIDVPAAQAIDLHDVLDLRRAEAMTHVVPDSTLIARDRLTRGPGKPATILSRLHRAPRHRPSLQLQPAGTDQSVPTTRQERHTQANH